MELCLEDIQICPLAFLTWQFPGTQKDKHTKNTKKWCINAKIAAFMPCVNDKWKM